VSGRLNEVDETGGNSGGDSFMIVSVKPRILAWLTWAHIVSPQ
jgi:hypothetical protein